MSAFKPTEVANQPEPKPMWREVWIGTLTKPSEATFRMYLDKDPDAGLGRALSWMFGATFVGGFIVMLILWVFSLLGLSDVTGFSPNVLALGIVFLCLVPFVSILSVFIFVIRSAIVHAIARLLGGEGDFGELAYAFAGYAAPLSLINSVLSPIPFLNFLLIPVGIYGLVLNVIAVKAVHRFDWGRAIISSLGIVILVIIISICAGVALIGSLAALAPQIGNIYTEILRDLSNTVP